ncbi:MAG: methionyl-tRNA formyltransferase [Gammaproteobacteria bacterium]|nr:methionyl-tRNA formyltransferase [Gammaproteobacteria bacterium]
MRIVLAGTPEFAAAHLRTLLDAGMNIVGVITQPDKAGKRGRSPVPGPVKRLALESGLDVRQPARLSASDLEPFKPDLLVVVAYGQILRADVLGFPPHGCLNVHASILPRWRGAAPIQRAILAGDDETGVCTMKMDEGLDTGDVYDCRRISIEPTDTTESLTGKLQQIGGSALIDTIRAIERGHAAATPQPETGITYATKIDKREARIDWQDDATHIEQAIRAFVPDPVAFTQLGAMRIKVWAAELASGEGVPGDILNADRTGIEVACGTGSLKLTRLQLPVGKGKVLTATDVLNSRRAEFAPGNRFERA